MPTAETVAKIERGDAAGCAARGGAASSAPRPTLAALGPAGRVPALPRSPTGCAGVSAWMPRPSRRSDRAGARAPAPMRRTRCWCAGTSLSACSAGWGRPSTSSARRAATLACACSLAGAAAIVSSTAVDPAGFDPLAERAVAMARVVPEDPYRRPCRGGRAGRAPISISTTPPSPTPTALIARAAAAEEAALAVPGVTNSRGRRGRLFGRTEVVLVTSAGFAGRFVRTGHSISATALAGARHRHAARLRLPHAVHRADLDDAAPIGRTRAARRRWRGSIRTRPKHGASCRWSSTRASAASLLGHLVGRDQRRGGRARHHVPEGPHGAADFRAGRRRHRRPAPAARPALAPVRRRGRADRARSPCRRRRARRPGCSTAAAPASSASPPPAMPARGTGGPPSPAPSNLYLCRRARSSPEDADGRHQARGSTSPS